MSSPLDIIIITIIALLLISTVVVLFINNKKGIAIRKQINDKDSELQLLNRELSSLHEQFEELETKKKR